MTIDVSILLVSKALSIDTLEHSSRVHVDFRSGDIFFLRFDSMTKLHQIFRDGPPTSLPPENYLPPYLFGYKFGNSHWSIFRSFVAIRLGRIVERVVQVDNQDGTPYNIRFLRVKVEINSWRPLISVCNIQRDDKVTQ